MQTATSEHAADYTVNTGEGIATGEGFAQGTMLGAAFRVDGDYLTSALKPLVRCNSTVDKTLQGIVFTAENGELQLSTLGQSFVAATRILDNVAVESEGSFILSRKAAEMLTKGVDDGDRITCEQYGNEVAIGNGGWQFDFPAKASEAISQVCLGIVTTEHRRNITLSQAEFVRLVDGSIYAVGDKKDAAIFRTLNLKIQNGKLAFTASNSHKLAMTLSEHFSASAYGDIDYNLNAEAVRFVKSTMSGKGDITLAVDFDAATSVIAYDAWQITAQQTCANEFPSVKQLFSEQAKTTATVNRAGLIKIVKFCRITADEHSAISLTFEGDYLTVEGRNENGDSATWCIEREDKGGEAIPGLKKRLSAIVGVNANYLLDALNSFDSETITLALTQRTLRIHKNNAVAVISPTLIKRGGTTGGIRFSDEAVA